MTADLCTALGLATSSLCDPVLVMTLSRPPPLHLQNEAGSSHTIFLPCSLFPVRGNISKKEKKAHVGRQVNVNIFLTYATTVSNLCLGSWLVGLVIHLFLLLRKYMRTDEAAERFCNVVRMESR